MAPPSKRRTADEQLLHRHKPSRLIGKVRPTVLGSARSYNQFYQSVDQAFLEVQHSLFHEECGSVNHSRITVTILSLAHPSLIFESCAIDALVSAVPPNARCHTSR